MAAFSQHLYSWALWATQPLFRRKLRRRAVAEPGYGEHVAERFGHYETGVKVAAKTAAGAAHVGPLVWIHAVSLGETRAAGILLPALRAQLPSMCLLLTHGTATGRAEGKKLLQAGDLQVWQPWDTVGATKRFLLQFQPDVGLLMETELWPNLITACKKQGVPLALANARLSEKSEKAALCFASLSRPSYAALSAVWAQTEQDAARLKNVGAAAPQVLGNIKFDVSPDAAQIRLGEQWRQASHRPVVMLASSREGEEAMWLAALEKIKAQTGPAVQWLVVPRHPQRFDAVAQLIEAAGLSLSRRSSWKAETADQSVDLPLTDVWLGDSLGEMQAYYALASVALLGGSFAPLGGQNLIEAAACGCPVITGPSTFNFALAAEQACATGAALRVADMDEAVAKAKALVFDAAALAQTRQLAWLFARSQQGAAQATAKAVAQLLKTQQESAI